MPPKLAELIAYCQAHGIRGSYVARHDPPWWRARVTVGREIITTPAEKREGALDRAAGIALDRLTDPPPPIGTEAYAAWQARRRPNRHFRLDGMLDETLSARSSDS